MTTNLYEWADRAFNSSPRYATGLTELLAARPYRVSTAVLQEYKARYALIRSFQQKALDLFRAALREETDPAVLHWLINETPESIGLPYHRALEDRHFTLPVFFRTDEVKPGRVIEVQCPGSAWGELQIAFEHAARMGYCAGDPSPAEQFATQLTDLLQTTAVVDHHLDNASAPAGMRYFIEKTRPRVRYWNIDRGIKSTDCNFIRSHAFFSICADKDFVQRLARVGHGVTYDLPPLILFDNKALLVLPFWSVTRGAFPDEVRNLFPFTTPLLPAGIELPDGTRVTVDEFARFPQSRRAYYLKYAGASLALNWGSKGVYRLSNLGSGACRDFMLKCLSGYEQGEIWLLQKEEFQEDDIEYLARDGAVRTERLRIKLSGYYGPQGCLGVLAMHRGHFKVHGQEETVLSYVLSAGEKEIPA